MGKGGRGGQRNNNNNNNNRSRNQHREDAERKRDERARRNALKKERQSGGFKNNDDEDAGFRSFRNQLQLQGFKLRDVVGDGNCLFRAFSDQMDGNETQHLKYRKDVVKYMEEHEDEFAPFLEETVNFKNYVKSLGERGTYGGNDSIVAFARGHGVDVVIHQLNNPTFIIEGNATSGNKVVVHLAYHDYEHYSSVRSANDPCSGPGCLFHKDTQAMLTERNGNSNNNNNNNNNNNGDAEGDEGLSRKERRKNKKKNVVQVEGNICELSQDFVRESIEELQMKSGCDDPEYIRKVFVDNSYDEDATLSFLLQTMHLHEERKKTEKDVQVEATGVSSEVVTTEQIAASSEHNVASVVTEDVTEVGTKEGTEDTKEESGDDGTKEDGVEELSTESDGDGEEEDERHSTTTTTTTTTPCKCDCNSQTCDCTTKMDSVPKTKGLNLKQPPVKNPAGKVRHMSNRQRKDMAKQERKKRRQETKKTTTCAPTTNTSSVEGLSENIKCINI